MWCPEVPPWEEVGTRNVTDKQAEALNQEDLPAAVAAVHEAGGDRFAGAWLDKNDSGLLLRVGVVGHDEWAALQAAIRSPGIVGLPTEVVAVPRSQLALEGPSERVDEILKSLTKDHPVYSELAIRPDTGQVLLTLPPGNDDLWKEVVEALGDPCAIELRTSSSRFALTYSRIDMPPFKAGKQQIMWDYTPPYPGFGCTTGFVFEENGTGNQPLRMSTAGHCTQGIVDVYDGHTPKQSAVGRTLSPNLFRASSPAEGDAVMWFNKGVVDRTSIGPSFRHGLLSTHRHSEACHPRPAAGSHLVPSGGGDDGLRLDLRGVSEDDRTDRLL